MEVRQGVAAAWWGMLSGRRATGYKQPRGLSFASGHSYDSTQCLRSTIHQPTSNEYIKKESNKMGRHACVIVLLAVCALWTFGETLSCDQCGRECVNSCGTRQFRACCFNNLKKRSTEVGFRLWVGPPRHTGHLHLVNDI